MKDRKRDTLLTSGDTEADAERASRAVQAEMRDVQLSAIINAVRRYRDVMREYRAEQMEMMDCGASLEDLVVSNWRRFAATQVAEEELFERLEALDVSERR